MSTAIEDENSREMIADDEEITEEVRDDGDGVDDDDDKVLSSEEMIKRFPPPPKRLCPWNEKPVMKNGQCIPRQDALLMEMVISDKATLKAQLDVTKKPIVGLEFLTEYIDPDGISPRVYHCELCKTYRTVSTIMEHITGYNHRVHYIAKKFPNEVKQYMLPNGTQKNRNKGLMLIAGKRVSELELVYGRGDYKSVKDKVKIPEGELDAPEKDGGAVPGSEDKQTEWLVKLSQDFKKIKLQTDEEVRIAKQIVATLTEAICARKFAGDRK